MSDTTNPPTNIPPTLDVSNGSKYIPPESGIGQRIRDKRGNFGLSVEALSILTAKYDYEIAEESSGGVSVPTLYRYEKGERLPGAREIRLLCNALGVSPNWLVLGQELEQQAEIDSEIAKAARKLFSLLGDEDPVRQNGNWSDMERSLKISQAKDSCA